MEQRLVLLLSLGLSLACLGLGALILAKVFGPELHLFVRHL